MCASSRIFFLEKIALGKSYPYYYYYYYYYHYYYWCYSSSTPFFTQTHNRCLSGFCPKQNSRRICLVTKDKHGDLRVRVHRHDPVQLHSLQHPTTYPVARVSCYVFLFSIFFFDSNKTKKVRNIPSSSKTCTMFS